MGFQFIPNNVAEQNHLRNEKNKTAVCFLYEKSKIFYMEKYEKENKEEN